MKEVEAGEMSLDRQIYLLIGGVQGRKIGNQAMESIFVNQAEASGLKMGETRKGETR
ncbi:MAG: hypothetical protein Q8O93_04525 [bacterium]|nr:hypothetical protein [bacterium]